MQMLTIMKLECDKCGKVMYQEQSDGLIKRSCQDIKCKGWMRPTTKTYDVEFPEF